ncbi:MAG TPA: YceI family protein [Rhodocyclaceae bacterium]|nr:YceI family protein [Rhodocyclaceae bacterium]
MKTKLASALFTATALALLAGPALAVEYTAVDPAQSKLTFAYTQMGVGMDGNFSKFSAKLAFNPAKPEAAHATMDVQLASIDTGSEEANGEVAGKAWFNTAAYPVAHFESSGVKALGGNRFQLTGKLTIKGRSKDISTPVNFTAKGNQGLFEGAFAFNRSDFAIGEGSWSDTSVVANPIQIRFKLLATGK